MIFDTIFPKLKRYKVVFFDLDYLRRFSMFKIKLYEFLPVTKTLDNYWLSWRLHQLSKKTFSRSLPKNHQSRFLMSLPHPTTGIGHSFSEWNTGRIIAKSCDLEFIHTPLPKEWESFLDLRVSNKTFSDIQHIPNLKIVHLPCFDYRSCNPCIEVKKTVDTIELDRPILFVLAPGQNLYDHSLFLDDLRGRYLKDLWNSDQIIFDRIEKNYSIEIVVHIRRGDVVEMKKKKQGNWEERYVELEYFRNILKVLSQILDGYSFNIKIFSQGREEEFHSFLDFQNTSLFINFNQNQTLAQMIKSDILVLSPSGFSFMAGLFSQGLKLARVPWWHLIPETQDWCQISNDPWKNYLEIEEKIQAYILCKYRTLNLDAKKDAENL
jgi:hypothetical protein